MRCSDFLVYLSIFIRREQLKKIRNTRILMPAAEDKMRKLPNYDWSEKKYYVTPSTHRLILKEVADFHGEECFVNSDDTNIVFARQKFYSECGGTTWTNETECLRCMMPDKFEVPPCKESSSVTYTQEFRCFCAHFCDNIRLFTIKTVDQDSIAENSFNQRNAAGPSCRT